MNSVIIISNNSYIYPKISLKVKKAFTQIPLDGKEQLLTPDEIGD